MPREVAILVADGVTDSGLAVTLDVVRAASAIVVRAVLGLQSSQKGTARCMYGRTSIGYFHPWPPSAGLVALSFPRFLRWNSRAMTRCFKHLTPRIAGAPHSVQRLSRFLRN